MQGYLRKFGKVSLVEGNKNGSYPFAHSLLIEGDKRVVVDPAAGRQKMQDIIDSGPVHSIINTHYHEDHVTYNYMFPDAEVYFSELDQRGFESIDGMIEMGIGKFMDAELRAFLIQVYTERFHFNGIKPTGLFKGDEEIDFGGIVAQLVHLPGHTPGLYGLHFPEEEFFFCADIDLASFGPWYGDDVSSLEDMISSIKKVKTIKAKWYGVSHEGPVYEDVSGPADKYLNVIYSREKKLLEVLGVPKTLDELADLWLMYGKAYNPVNAYRAAEKALLSKHLEQLERDGKVRNNEGKFEKL